MASKYKSLDAAFNRNNFSDSSTDTTETPLKEDLENLFGPMFDEYFKRSSKKEHSSPEPTNYDNASNQEDNVAVDVNEFVNSFSTSLYEEDESSSSALDPSNMHTFYQQHP
nr:hypothetical protein [Tanacetum cinerariifolium]